MRSMMRAPGVCVAAVLIGGCAAASATATTPSPSIRGPEMSAYSCHGHVVGHSGGVTPSRVTAFRLCPLNAPNSVRKTVTVLRGDGDFARLLRALSAPDLPPYDGPCPMYADLPQRVLAETATGARLVHIPVDGCGHYQSAALSALSAARGQS
jgi:hypothetical protein